MAKFSVKAYLEDHHGMTVKGAGKLPCPICSRRTFGVNKADSLGKCFHPQCGYFINARSVTSDTEPFQQLLWEFVGECHKALLAQAEATVTVQGNAWRYLTEDRKVESQVIVESPVLGVVPSSFGFDKAVTLYRQQIQLMSDDRQRADRLKTFDGYAQQLREVAQKYQGWLVFAFTDVTHRILSLKLRKPYTKTFCQFKPFNQAGVFNLQLFETDETAPWPYLLLVEGEFNLLSLQSLLIRNRKSYCKALALGSATSVDWVTLGHFREHWVLFQDSDTAGASLSEEMQQHRTFRLAKSEQYGDDLDDVINRFSDSQKGLEAIQTILKASKVNYRFLDAISEDLKAIRRKEKNKCLAFEINQRVGELVVSELKDRGQFYKTPMAPYFMDEETRNLYLLNRSSKETLRYLHRFSLNPAESLHQFVLNELERVAFEQGSATTIYQFTHYDQLNNRIYLFNRDHEVYRISTTAIDVLSNGCDQVLFEPLPGYTPFERETIESATDLLSELYLSQINLDDGPLSTEEYQLLLQTWVYHLFFDGLHATHPIVTFVGPKGSSKTSSIRRLGLLLFGPNFQVCPIPDKPDDFDATVTNGFLVGFDNVDSQTQWLNNKLAIVATGGCIKRRELYSTNNLVEYPIRAQVAITSRTPKFRRDDVAERLLIFPLKTLDQKISEQYLISNILTHRNQFMSWLLLRLQELLRTLEQTTDQTAFQTGFRMADFATFMLRLASSEGAQARVTSMLERLVTVQSQFTLEQDPLFELLTIIATNHPAKPFTTAELHQALTQIAAQTGIRYTYKSANSLGQKLTHLKANIEQLMNMHVNQGSGNTKLYSFWPKV